MARGSLGKAARVTRQRPAQCEIRKTSPRSTPRWAMPVKTIGPRGSATIRTTFSDVISSTNRPSALKRKSPPPNSPELYPTRNPPGTARKSLTANGGSVYSVWSPAQRTRRHLGVTEGSNGRPTVLLLGTASAAKTPPAASAETVQLQCENRAAISSLPSLDGGSESHRLGSPWYGSHRARYSCSHAGSVRAAGGCAGKGSAPAVNDSFAKAVSATAT
jgi:hypothetical protein